MRIALIIRVCKGPWYRAIEKTIFVGVVLYLVMMIAVGIYASRKSLSMTQFVVAGRGLPVWLCSTTIVATWYGGGTLLGSAGAAYDSGFLGVIYDPFGASLSLLLLGLFFVRLFRRLRILTVAAFM